MPLRILSPLHRATRQIAMHLEAPCRRLGMAPREGHLLSYLRRYAPCPIGELHRVFGHKRSTLTGMLDRLEQRGLLRRRRQPHDRRSYLVELTAAGEALATELQSMLEALEEAVMRRVDRRQLAGFEAVLTAIDAVTRVEVRPSRDTDATDGPPGRQPPVGRGRRPDTPEAS
ncbi:MAG: MarR family winged helix-turn-helix transcriptional regulator [Candidatus Eiseniibacteriota bacterium]